MRDDAPDPVLRAPGPPEQPPRIPPGLVPCRACKAPISVRAVACPACGEPGLGAPKPREESEWRAGAVCLFWVWLLGGAGLTAWALGNAADAVGGFTGPTLAAALLQLSPLLSLIWAGAVLLALITLMTRPAD